MPVVQLRTKAEDLAEQVRVFVRAISRRGEHDAEQLAVLFADIARLQVTNVCDASAMRARLFSTVGNEEDFKKAIANLKKNGAEAKANILFLEHYVNHGFATLALQLLEKVYKERVVSLMQIAQGAVAAGAFHSVVAAVNAANENQEVLAMTGLYEKAQRAVETMDALGVTDKDLAAMLDVAGELMRREKLQWIGTEPDVYLLRPEHGGPALSYSYRIGVTPEEAARLDWELTESLVERELDRPRCGISFIGTKLPARVAA